MVEHWSDIPKVVGSIPTHPTLLGGSSTEEHQSYKLEVTGSKPVRPTSKQKRIDKWINLNFGHLNKKP